MKSNNKIGGFLVAFLLAVMLAPICFGMMSSSSRNAQAAGCTSGNSFAGSGVNPSATAEEEIPGNLMPIFRAAERRYKVPWFILAGINRVETEFGKNLNVSSAGAVGWMQFMPETWASYGVDANGDGHKDPFDPEDAIFAAANYLHASGAPGDIRKAIFAYNHADWYVDKVLGFAGTYAKGGFKVGGDVGPGKLVSAGTCPVVPSNGKITTKGGAKGIVDQAAALAAEAGGSDVYVCSDFRSGSVTTSGNGSDHASNDANMAARDISLRGTDCILGPPSANLDRAVVAIGKALGVDYGSGDQRIVDSVYWKGFRVQIIWRTPEYGGHMGHIHIGARKQ